LICNFLTNLELCKGLELTVDKDGRYDSDNFTNIQDAIDSAKDGDIIFILNGIYYENLIVNKSISLFGENRNNTIIEGNGSDILVHISEKNVDIGKLTISNGNIGVYIVGYNDILTNSSISNITFLKNNVSIYFSSVTYSTIKNNNISDNIDGITLFNSSYNLIKNNIITFQKNIGISLWDHSNNNEISFNILYENDQGLLLRRWLDGSKIFYNIFNNNSIGVYLELNSNTSFNKNFISTNYYGMRLRQSLGNNSIFNNTIQENVYGIDVDRLEKFYMTDNYFINNTYDIKQESEMPRIKTPDFNLILFICSIFIVMIVKLKKYNKKKKK